MRLWFILIVSLFFIVNASFGRRSSARIRPAVPRPVRRPASRPVSISSSGLKPARVRQSSTLGSLSAKYESGKRGPGTINPYKGKAKGDIGGASYGSYQISTKQETMSGFLKWMKQRDPNMAASFDKLTPGTPEFDSAWKKMAAEKPKEFGSIQHDFIKSTHYDKALLNLSSKKNLNLNLNERSPVIKDVIWSTSVQHGATRAATIIERAVADQDISKMTDADFINRIYSERGADNGKKYFSSQSDDIRQSVVNRFKNEANDALQQLK